ncbi:MAG TPA: POT family MFS transporter [Verrucomicrobiota bacterium]|nr:POT family MFS transporter [Verrucomicrobiota bacterium]
MSVSRAPEASGAKLGMPRSVPFIVGNEAAERFSYYGVIAILTLYMMKVLGLSNADATEIAHLFKFAVYFMPLLGAYIADRLWGRYYTILYLSLVYCVGNAVLALTVGSKWGLYIGLFLIAIGSGGIKPCVSAFVGDQFGPGREHLLPKIYGMFYWSINFGSFFAFGFLPTLRDNAGYRWAFGIPGVAMFLATFIFWIGTRSYQIKPPVRDSTRAGFFRVFWHALRRFFADWLARRRNRPAGGGFWDAARGRFTDEEVSGARAVAGILMIFASVPIFWSLFDQTNTTWVIQGTKMTAVTLFSFTIDPQALVGPMLKGFFTELSPGHFALVLDTERMQAMNPLFVMLLIPLFTAVLYPASNRLGLKTTPLRRMSVGMLLAAVSFVVCAWIQSRMDAGEAMAITWQMIPYLLLTSGEVMLSATGLEFAFSQAPASMKSTIMSFWLLTVAIGNLLVAAVTDLNDKLVKAQGASQFLFYALLMFLVAGVFIYCATRYRERPIES